MQRAGRLVPATTVRRVLGVSLGALIGPLVGAVGCARSVAEPAAPAIHDAWTRPAAAGADGALYFTVINPGRDTLVVVGARAAAADRTSLHESMHMGEGAAAMVHMMPVARLAVAPADSIRFAPLGRHAMLERLRRPLVLGDSVPFALAVVRDGHADTVRATAVVRAF